MFPLFSVNYVDNYWIKDRTFFSDMKLGLENAALGMELSGLQNWQIRAFNPGFYDTNSLFTQFLETSAKNAQAMTANMFCGLPGMALQMPSVTDNKIKEKGPKDDLTDEEKEEFNTLKKELDDLYNSLNELDRETIEALELENTLEDAKKGYDSKTPNEMKKCIDNLKSKIRNLGKKDETLKKILNKVTAEGVRDDRADKLYNTNTTREEIENLFASSGAAPINKTNIIAELDYQATRIDGKTEKSLIDALTSRKDAKKPEIQNAIRAIKNALLDRANEPDVNEYDDVLTARNELKEAYSAYSTEINEENTQKFVNAFENLYKQIKLAKAKQQDEANRQKILDLPEILQEFYLDEDGKLKEKFKINETQIVKQLNLGSPEEKDKVEETEMKGYKAQSTPQDGDKGNVQAAKQNVENDKGDSWIWNILDKIIYYGGKGAAGIYG